MIFVSSSCARGATIADSVEKLVALGFRNIELSGGTAPYPSLQKDLLELQQKYGLNYLCHNYFPPSPVPFVINIASLDDEVSRKSMAHLEQAIELSRLLGAKRFGFHAGFLINIPVSQVGKSISHQQLFDRKLSTERFVQNYTFLKNKAGDIELYLENNVVSETNLRNFNGQNPFFLTSWSEFIQLSELMQLKPLLDVAHLKVSSQSLGLSFDDELQKFWGVSDYIHISDNDGTTDNNRALKRNSALYESLSRS